MRNTARIGIVLPLPSLGLVGCTDGHALSAPSAPSSLSQTNSQPTVQLTAQPQRTVTSITPNTGSTRGDAWGTIIGAQFQPGARVTLGSGGVAYALVQKDGTIFFRTNASVAGRVDVTVTNPGGLSDNLAGAYTFAPPEAFDFNGDWDGCIGDGGETCLHFTIRDRLLVRLSCGGVVLTLPTGSPVHNAEFSFLGDDGAAVSGRLVSPVGARGTVNVGPCIASTWQADKSGGGKERTLLNRQRRNHGSGERSPRSPRCSRALDAGVCRIEQIGPPTLARLVIFKSHVAVGR